MTYCKAGLPAFPRGHTMSAHLQREIDKAQEARPLALRLVEDQVQMALRAVLERDEDLAARSSSATWTSTSARSRWKRSA